MTGRDSVFAVTSLIVAWASLTLASSPASAQNSGVETAGHVGILRLSELDTTDVGVGADLIWRITSGVAVDGAFTWFPAGGDDAAATALENQHRALGLVGVRAIVGSDDVELFARGRAGFLRFGEQGPTVCIAIFPPPLSCRLSGGYTAFASHFGAGASVALASPGRLRVHIEAGDLLVRYGIEAFRPGREGTDGFVSHNLLVSIGLGWRF